VPWGREGREGGPGAILEEWALRAVEARGCDRRICDRSSSPEVAKGRLTFTVNEGATAAAVAGLGIVSTGLWGCRAELASGALVRVLDDWSMTSVEIHAVFPAGRGAKRSARAFADYLIDELKE